MSIRETVDDTITKVKNFTETDQGKFVGGVLVGAIAAWVIQRWLNRDREQKAD